MNGATRNMCLTIYKENIFLDKKPVAISPEHLRYMELIGELCRKHNIKLHFFSAPFYGPRYDAASNHDELINTVVKPVCTKYNADYVNFNGLPFNNYAALYADPLHLNKNGLEVYMQYLINTYKANDAPAGIRMPVR